MNVHSVRNFDSRAAGKISFICTPRKKGQGKLFTAQWLCASACTSEQLTTFSVKSGKDVPRRVGVIWGCTLLCPSILQSFPPPTRTRRSAPRMAIISALIAHARVLLRECLLFLPTSRTRALPVAYPYRMVRPSRQTNLFHRTLETLSRYRLISFDCLSRVDRYQAGG